MRCVFPGMVVVALVVAGSAQAPTGNAERSVEVVPWGGVPIRGTAVRATPCGITVRIVDQRAHLELPWSEVRSMSPVEPAWDRWIEAGDALRRGAERLARGDAALAAVAYARAVERLEQAEGACVVQAWRGWANALEASRQAVAAMVARLKADDLAARMDADAVAPSGPAAAGDEGNSGWPVDLCPACSSAAAAGDASTALDASPLKDPRVGQWGALIREVVAQQAGDPPRPLPKGPRPSTRDDSLKRERRILEAWLEALGPTESARERARADLAQLLGRTEGPLRHWCRAAIGLSLLREAQVSSRGTPAARDAALDAAEQFLTIVACDDPSVPMLSATAAELGASALELAGDQRGATTVRRALLGAGAAIDPAATRDSRTAKPSNASQASSSSQASQEGRSK